MELFEAIERRYSHKARFSKENIPEKDLQRIVRAGMAAPSAGNTQSPEFIIVNDPEIIEEISDITDNAILQSAPALIAVLTHPRVHEVLDITTECLIADFAVATENMLLAATALGYKCGWLDGPFNTPGVREQTQQVLGIPDDRLLALVVPVGHPAEQSPRRQKKPFEQRASWNGYDIVR
ncbi:MAG: nitroreductase family protein [Anaerolineales bacterium]